MEQKCSDCSLRAKYDKNPKSFMGKFWRWHINFCPGWKAYFQSLAPKNRRYYEQSIISKSTK